MSKHATETTLYSLSQAAPRRPERRNDERYLTLLRVGALQIGGRRELCLIRNISAGGMMIRPYSVIEPGTRLSVELKQGDMVSGTAQWSDNGLTGVTFDAPIDVVALLSASGERPQPRMPRVELNCSALLRHESGVYRVRALNISQGGICLEMETELPANANVVVTLTGLASAAGVVKWREEANYGIGFNRVYPVGELMSFLREQQQDERRRAAG